MSRSGVLLRTLREARDGPGEFVSVCAYVLSVKGPFPSRGLDHNIHLQLQDASLLDGEDPLACIIFGPPEMLCQIKGLDGRILIYFHKARKHTYQGKPQLMVKLKPNRTPQDGDTFSVYRCEPEGVDTLRPWFTSHGHALGVQVDEGRILELQRWVIAARESAAAAEVAAPAAAAAEAGGPVCAPFEACRATPAVVERPVRKIRELMPPWQQLCDLAGGGGSLEPVDLVCRILAIDFTYLPNFFIVFVWDGTDAQPLPLPLTLPPPAQPQPQHHQPQQPHSYPQHRAQPQPRAELGGAQASADGAGVSAGCSLARQKRGREEADASAGDDSSTGPPQQRQPQAEALYDDEVEGEEALPYRGLPYVRRLQMPLVSMAQYGGEPEEAATMSSADSGGGAGRSGWEAISAVLCRDEMPLAGSSVPLLLPAAAFTLHVPGPTVSTTTNTAEAAPGAPAPVSNAAGGSGGGEGTRASVPSAMPPQEMGGARQQEQQQQRPRQALPRPGEWVKLRSVTPHVARGQVQLSYTAQSAVAPADAADCTALMETYGARCAVQGGGAVPNQFAPKDPEGLLARAVKSWQALPLRTLRQLLMQQDACDCTPARVLARIVVVCNLGEQELSVAPQSAAAGAPNSEGGAQKQPAPAGSPQPPAATDPSQATGDGGAGTTGGATWDIGQLLAKVVFPATSLHVQEEVAPGSRLDRGRNGRTYALVLQLEDGTATLQAALLGGAANLFLWHMPPPDPVLTMGEGGDGQRPPGQPGASQPAARSSSSPSPSSSLAISCGGVRTRSQAARRQGQQQQGRQQSEDDGRKQGRRRRQREPPVAAGPQGHLQGTDPAAVLATLRALADQTVSPDGVWLECVIRPYYRDRDNPWQSAVYSLEHTVMRASAVAAAVTGAGGLKAGAGGVAAAAASAGEGSPAPSI